MWKFIGGLMAAFSHGPAQVALVVLVCVVVGVALVLVVAAVFADGPGRRLRALLVAWGVMRGRVRPDDE